MTVIIIIALIVSHAVAFLAGALCFRNNSARIARAEQDAREKAVKAREIFD